MEGHEDHSDLDLPSLRLGERQQRWPMPEVRPTERLDAELALLLECTRRRRELGDALLVELNRAIEVQQRPALVPRKIPASGYREVGMARFRNVRIASANESR